LLTTLAALPSNHALAIQLFFVLAVILGACRVVGVVGRWVGQPQVVSEMIAGVLLGPSLLGMLAPDVQASLFPASLMPILYVLAQVALALYMFTVGLEFRPDLLRQRIRGAVGISASGIVVPFALGAAGAVWLSEEPEFFAANVSTAQAVLFTGAAMSITAFPMLARIIVERGLAGTRVGTLALAAGSIDDAIAWCILAIVLASFRGEPKIALFAIGGGFLYVIIAATLVRPIFARVNAAAERNGSVTPAMFALVLTMLMVGAWFTDLIGIYAVFGAFILGVVIPRGMLTQGLIRKIEPLTCALFLPMFFVYSGLNTRIDLVNTPYLWLVTAGVLGAACIGKGVACWGAARLCGENNRDATAIGALMNARGLMELIILNIGLEYGIITPTLFSIMVLMAIATTLGATPVFEWLGRSKELGTGRNEAGFSAIAAPIQGPIR